ncbi:GNAT family N-acetyltransferase [Geobacter anodireducens]|uniref:GNAT family N-acetyltransferase n=1 Tax=Geobacter anodireducens TaxID=1340425 RepID=A0ABR9NXB3_9BACT|nr:GNAT family N-acetyltransferase [Geobacter anodireducens]
MRDPFKSTPYSPENVYYIGELLFRLPYRSRGLGRRLLTSMESHIRSLGSFHVIVCATVERPLDHPCRRHEYIPINNFLDRTGFVRLDGITTHFTWMEIDGARHNHTMQFWMKDLSQPCPQLNSPPQN